MNRIVLDKTPDGRYWTLEGRVGDRTALRLRVAHLSDDDPSEVRAEVGVCDASNEDVVWTQVAGPFLFALGTPDCEPEERWTSDFPDVWHEEFVELGRILGRIGGHVDLGPAYGTLTKAAA